MSFEVYKNNGGQYRWCLVGDDGVELAARGSADAVRAHTQMPEPGR